MIRVGVIGCGLVAQIMHLHYLRELSDRFQIAAVCDVSPGARSYAAAEYGAGRAYADWHELVDSDVDAVLVLTGESHADPAIAAAEHGKHVFVEKPMCFNLSEADRMIEAARRHHVALMVGYMKRHDPAYAFARDQLASLEEPRHALVTTLNGPLHPYISHYPLRRFADVPAEISRHSAAIRKESLELALGMPLTSELGRAYHEVLLDSAIHELNLIRGFFGDPERVVSAHFWDAGQSFVTVLEYPRQLRVTLNWVTLTKFTGWRQELNFYGQSGAVTLAFPSPFLRSEPTKVILEGRGGSEIWRSEVILSYEEAFKRELIHFHSCIREGTSAVVSGEDAKGDIALALAIVRSHLSAQPQVFANGTQSEVAASGRSKNS